MSRYFSEFSIVELQSTFYKLPMVKTAEKWRSQAPEGFEFTLKAWQGVTHPSESPTWKRSGLSRSEVKDFGKFTLSEKVF